jgi:localization factor PodJL
MRFGLPWRVKGIRHETRETAEVAARRAGLPLNEWLNAIILQQAASQGIKPQAQPGARNDSRPDDYSRVQMRPDHLSRRIEQITHAGPTAYAPKRTRHGDQLDDQFHGGTSRWPAPQSLPAFDQAVAEFTARRQALNAEENLATTRTPAQPQGVAGLEDQLRRITEQIEALKRPGVEDAIRLLRAELGQLGHTLNEALPRHAIETLEMQVQVLTQRIAEGREAGADSSALAGIENGLAEVRDALHNLMPAENLVGYNEAIRALTQKIDLIVADKNPATMQQLERSLATLREMSAHVASNDTVSRLSAQVQTIADKIDRVAVGSRSADTLDGLESRIDALTRALAERTQIDIVAPQRLEALVQTLSEKIAQLQKSGSSEIAASHLEDRIVKLTERLNASDSRLNKLDAIERGLADLLTHIEELRANKSSTIFRAEGPSIEVVRRDILQTRKSVEAVHRRLSDLFSHLATVEKSAPAISPETETPRSDNFDFAVSAISVPIASTDAAPKSVPEKIVPALLRDEIPTPEPIIRPAALPATPPAPSHIAAAEPIVSATPPDRPLEPGSGPPRRAISPGLRIAASEAALGGARPAAGTSASKSNFIAAARRAAQAAGQGQNSRAAGPETRRAIDGATPPVGNGVAKRAKSALLVASIIAITAGSLQIMGNVFDFSIVDTIESKLTAGLDNDSNTEESTATIAAIPDDEPEGTAEASAPAESQSGDVTVSMLSPEVLPSLTPALPTSPPVPAAPPLLAPPALNAPGALPTTPASDVTGSVAHPVGAAKQQASPQEPASADRLPASIGNARLRNAALGGDTGAAYEVAMRFVEGRGVSANLEEAARWFERAASKGLTPAQFRYASMLEKGQGVKKDLVAAQKLYIAAAGKGHAKAMHNLAVLYAEGAEGKPDYTSAAQWFRKAAEYGVADSQYNLGVLAARGLGTERNMAESYKWFALAAAQGDKEAAKKRDEIAPHLDAQTLASAQQVVKAFAPAQQPAEAITVAAPPGGWDGTTQPAQIRQRAAGPLSIEAFNSGKL